MSAHAAAQLLKQQIPLLDYLVSQQWQPARRIARGRLLGLCPLHADRLCCKYAETEASDRRRSPHPQELRAEAEDRMNEIALSDWIALRDPADLPFADRMHCLIAFDRPACAVHRTKPEACGDPLLYEPMILLDDVVQIGRGSAATALAEFAGPLQFGNRAGVSRMPIDVDDPRRGSAAAGQCQAQEQLRRDQVALGRQHELDGFSGRVDCSIEICPVAGNLDVRLADPPGSIRSRSSRRIL
jgi:hypothetical protein